MFKFLDRKKRNSIVLIPGWGFDYDIFCTLALPYNYFFFCDNKTIFSFEKDLKETLRKSSVEKISLFGWSQGAFLAYNFARKNPAIIDEIFLVSTKRKYKKENLENIKRCLKRSKSAYLYKFYKECFCEKEAGHLRWFKEKFLKDYIKRMQLEDLITSLDWLARAEIVSKDLNTLKRIKIIHGREDRIVPVKESADIKKSLPQAELIVFDNTGHLPFLREDFKANLADA